MEYFNKTALKLYNSYLESEGKPPISPNNSKINLKRLETQLAATDYQVIKCYEYSLAGLELPYDIQELHNSREAIREQIRELEEQI